MDEPFALALGANAGPAEATLAAALERLGDALGPLRIAPLFRSAPVPPSSQSPFLNTAATGRTRLAPGDVLALGKALELAAGRRPPAIDRPRFGPRPLDVDLLLFGSRVSDFPELTLPHPRLRERRFMLAPLAAIAPDLPVPPDGRTVRDLLAALGPPTPEEWVEQIPWHAA